MLLAIDVGNTQTVLGLYGGEGPGRLPLVDHWRVATASDRTADELALLIAQLLEREGHDIDADVTGLAVSCVVPRVTSAVREMLGTRLGVPAVIVEPGVKTGIPILYDNPKEVGADRIADAVGAHDLYGGPCIVVDFGTATTVDAVSAKGEYLGGAIVPGLEISLEALFGKAAALRRVELGEPRRVIGRSTAESIQSGALHGYAGQVDALCNLFEEELGPAVVVATGGLARFVATVSSRIAHVEPWLTLHGLRVIYERNRP